MVTLVYIKNNEPIIGFKETGEPVFYNNLLYREISENGIKIISADSRQDFDNKSVVFLPKNRKDDRSIQLFKQAFMNIYCPPIALKNLQLEWRKS